MCEQINHCWLDARDKSILTMLEWIREYIMKRLQKNKENAECKWEGRILCGKSGKIVSNLVKFSSDCTPIKTTDNKYEILSYDGSRYAVDLEARTCDCRRWELSGIPCKHAVSAICAEGHKPEDFVHRCYFVDTYFAVYKHAIAPMNGPELWEKTGYIPPLPPNFHKRKRGRPQVDRKFGRHKSPKKKKQSSNLQSMGKQHFIVKCKFCGESGHIRLGCAARKAAEGEDDGSAKKRDIFCTFCLDFGHAVHGCIMRHTFEDEFAADEEADNVENLLNENVADEEANNVENLLNENVQEPEIQTQKTDAPNATQPTQDEYHADAVNDPNQPQNQHKPTTRKGRKILASKRIAAARAKKIAASEEIPSEAYSISISLQ